MFGCERNVVWIKISRLRKWREFLALVFHEGNCENCKSVGICSAYAISKKLYNAGYRKASDVAEDIIRTLRAAGINEWRYPVIAELKKKYESEKDNGN